MAGRRLIAGLMALAIVGPAQGNLRVFACEPEWASLVQELGGEDVGVRTATTAHQDPHRVQARPSLIAAVRRADLVVCTGAELEIGWLPVLLRRAGNPRVQPGQPGYFEAARFVRLKDVPARVDRSAGDVHPSGNPHIQTDPRNIARVADALGQRLAELEPGRADAYRRRLDDFQHRWSQALARWQQQGAELRGLPLVTQHKGWVYLIDWLGLHEVATLEPTPGIPPSTAYLSSVLSRIERTPSRAIVRAPYQDPRASEWLAERTDLPIVELPFTVGGNEAATDLFALFDDTLRRLREVTQ